MESVRHNREFDAALADFTSEAAYGRAVRHLAELGYSVDKIQANLDYPASRKDIAEEVWNHYVETGRILLEEPENYKGPERVTFVKTTGPYGRTSFIKKTEKLPALQGEYCRCDFGLIKARSPEDYQKQLDLLQACDREYITDLPWPRKTVWHLLDERMTRIQHALGAGMP